ncbi:hypothetical protein TSTA_005660 [Talaromyces stipitatus ATCC 10500]|uniref:TOM complex component Tom7 n=1 Tax=Talaromyces stipitatus (strain ATCC 10500 / CBS 375.48 / QM 6759 / NRRL 1006) TaxID=441959 RepID=B8MTQ0_TALSN|nr:uncharacterized protein TSTA_005660 [Talaromyces stipitatus ATCC 10500]EED12535.1 hypothetical protein TSTA_005660 [Talaromyces stipitatus ATCC 10500]
MVQFSEETKERISKVIEVSRIAVHYGYLPFIVYLGEQSNDSTIPWYIINPMANSSPGYTYSEPKPTLFKYFPSAADPTFASTCTN